MRPLDEWTDDELVDDLTTECHDADVTRARLAELRRRDRERYAGRMDRLCADAGRALQFERARAFAQAAAEIRGMK